MDIKVHVEIPALDRLVEVLKAGVGPAAANAAAPKTVAKTVDKPKDEPAKVVETKTEEQPKTEPAGEPADETALRDAAKAAAMKLQQKSGKDALVSLLAEYGAPNITGLPIDRVAAFTAEATTRAA